MINHVVLKGFVASEPLIRATENGRFAALRLATVEHLHNSRTGKMRKHTEWHSVIAFGDMAILIDEQVRLGMALEVIGSLRTREWRDREGVVQKRTEIAATAVAILDRIDGCDIPQSIRDEMKQNSSQRTTPPPSFEVKAPAEDPDGLPF